MPNDRLIKALLRQPVDKTPIWIMRQAGRYLPEYRATRAKAGDFMTLCKTPELACEVTLQPLARFDLDAAILFSDILTIPEAMGLGLHFVADKGPQFARPVQTEKAIRALPTLSVIDDLGYVMEAVAMIRQSLAGKVPLIGFSGSPWTLACYMVQGGASKDFCLAKAMLYSQPDVMHALLTTLAATVTAYLNAQIAAGVQVVMLFDTWGGILTTPAYQVFSLPYLKQIIQGLTTQVDGQIIPTIVFTKNGGQWLEAIAAIGCHAVGLDWTTDIGAARQRVGEQVALQGNLDPCVLYATPQAIQQQAEKILQAFGPGPGHVFNLGHGITPEVSPEHLAVLIDAVHGYTQCP